MSMRTENAIYRVEICDWTGVQCIYCNPGPCEHRKVEKRHHPWSGSIDVDAENLQDVPEEDLRGHDGDAEPKIDQNNMIHQLKSGGRMI